jgi:hypothetical protein
LIVAACAPATATEQPSIIMQRPTPTPMPRTPVPEQPTATPVAEEPASPEPASEQPLAGPVEKAVIKQLATNLGVPESDIAVISYEAVEFSDSCMDIVLKDVQCSQVITPGRVIILEANGIQYRYHTNENGSRIQPANIALIWKREGGIAGFCDTLVVFLSGEVFASQCKPQAEGQMGIFADLLSVQEQKQFNGWVTKFAETHLDASDPRGVSDRMVVTLELFGNGSKPPTKSEQQALFKFSQDLYQELMK